jgi:hypothetical protein
MGSLASDASGITTFRVPKGDYDVEVVWQESVVYKAIRTVDTNEATTLSAFVFYADLHVVDSMDTSIAAALVSLTNTSSGRAMGDLATDDLGHVTFRLPMGVYTVEVLWADTMVFDDFITVDTNGLHLIVADVYYPGFDIADSRDQPLVGALVTLARTSDGRIIASHLTDITGATTFRVPKGNYHVTVVWLDTLVHDGNYDVVSNDRFPVEANVYYAMFVAVDSQGVGLENAQVVVENSTTLRSMGALTADGSGQAEFRLPVGEYRVEVIWQHARVYLGTWLVDDDATITLDGWVYYVTFHVTDGAGIDLEDAKVGLVNETAGTALGTLTTDANGEVEFRLPLGDAALTVTWKTVLVHEDPAVPITMDEVVEISAKVYYLEVRVIGSDGSKVKKANVDVIRDGLAVASDLTDGKGSAMFRLPVGQYVVNMTFSTTQHLTQIDVKHSRDVDLSEDVLVRFKLTEDEYPLPFLKTNLFWIILMFVLLIILVIYLVYRVSKAAKAVPEEGTEEPLEYDESDLDDLLEDLDEEAIGAAVGGVLLGSDETESDFEELPPEDEEQDAEVADEDVEGEDVDEEPEPEEDEEEAFEQLEDEEEPEELPDGEEEKEE